MNDFKGERGGAFGLPKTLILEPGESTDGVFGGSARDG